MQRYPVRNTHRSRLTLPALEEAAREVFGSAERSADRVTTRYGAITRLDVWPIEKELAIEVETDPQVPSEVQSESIRRYNRFLETATGFSSKERAKRLRKSVQGPERGS